MEERPKSQEKQIIPQLNKETGISADYRNTYVVLKTWLNRNGIDSLKNFIKSNEIKLDKYEEFFSPIVYKDVINPKNRGTVIEINKLIDAFNDKTNKENIESFSLEDFNKIFESLEVLIVGKI